MEELDTIVAIWKFITPSSSGIVLPDMKDLSFYEVVLERRNDDA